MNDRIDIDTGAQLEQPAHDRRRPWSDPVIVDEAVARTAAKINNPTEGGGTTTPFGPS